uniref:RING-type E3 ubiquitin transferase n=1 Tax=Leersia perrieri TaxID=77586 RepID=A0A0D9VU80_9ORYZ
MEQAMTTTGGGSCDGDGGGGGIGCLLSGIACCVAGAAFYFAGRRSLRAAAKLRLARRFTRISDLSAALDSEGDLPLVTISGQVGSETPILSPQNGCQAVITEQNVTQHYKTKHVTTTRTTEITENEGVKYLVLKETKKKDGDEYLVVKRTTVKDGTEHRLTNTRNDKVHVAEQWVHGTKLVSSTKHEVPWYLEDATGRLYVVEARKATGFGLSRESSVYDENKPSCTRCQACGLEDSVKIVGLERTERVLQIGTTFTSVGRAYKDRSNGAILIKRPKEIGGFYVSRSTIDQIISDLRNSSRNEDNMAVIFAISGGVLLACHLLL